MTPSQATTIIWLLAVIVTTLVIGLGCVIWSLENIEKKLRCKQPSK